jgi:hypothetical protein
MYICNNENCKPIHITPNQGRHLDEGEISRTYATSYIATPQEISLCASLRST